MKDDRKIVELSDREHILNRPGMYIGGTSRKKVSSYYFEDSKIEYKTLQLVPGLLKILNELIDNSVDELALRKIPGKVKIFVDETSFRIRDTGFGIAAGDLEKAFCKARSGSNFGDERAGIGQNGTGALACNIFSKKFVVNSQKNGVLGKMISKNNMETFSTTTKEVESDECFTEVYCEPDFSLFEIDSLDADHIQALHSRISFLSVNFKNLKFYWNKERISCASKNLKDEESLVIESPNYDIIFCPLKEDDAHFFCLINGLIQNENSGSFYLAFQDLIVKGLHKKLIKQIDTLKTSDVKLGLGIVGIFRNFLNPEFSSQSKTELTNKQSEVLRYLNFSDQKISRIINMILKKDNIINPIISLAKAKTAVQITSTKSKGQKNLPEKYTPPTKNYGSLILVEGDSAKGSLLKILGRENFGFFPLKGKPLNIITSRQQKILANNEIKSILQILKSHSYEKILIASDADADGSHIRLLLTGLFYELQKEFIINKKFCVLNTPVIIGFNKKNIPEKWYYEIPKEAEMDENLRWKYFKGLASFQGPELKYIMEDAGGVENVMEVFLVESDDEENLYNWLGKRFGNS